MRKSIAVFLGFGLMCLIAACGGGAASSIPSSVTPAPTPPATGASSYPFEVVVSSQYEMGGTATVEADCQVPVGTASGTTLVCKNTAGASNSTVAIPEGRLYFSKLSFTLSTNSTSSCEIISFSPFYYVANKTSAAFLPPWVAASVDCTKSPLATDCYGGIAKDIVPGFPTYKNVYFMTSQSLTQVYTGLSANKHSYGSNRFTVNNLVTRNGASHAWANADAYVGASNSNYQDYYFACLDKYYQTVYAFTMTLTDIDITGVYPNASQGNNTINQFPDWDVLSWDN